MSTSTVTRRTFLGKLLSAVPAVGLIPRVLGSDPVITTAIIRLHWGDEFRCEYLASSKQRVFFNGQPLPETEKKIFGQRFGDDHAVSIKCHWRSPSELQVDYFCIGKPQNEQISFLGEVWDVPP